MNTSTEILEKRTRRRQVATRLGPSIALGAGLGAALGNIAVGLVAGILIGGLAALYRIKKSG